MAFSTDYPSGKLPVQKLDFSAIETVQISWDSKFVIDSLPPWVYKNHPMPRSVAEAEGKISSLEHTIQDMDIQIEIRESHKQIDILNREYDELAWQKKYRQILKAKQSTLYVISALKYWVILNNEETNVPEDRFNDLVRILIEEPADYVDQLRDLLN